MKKFLFLYCLLFVFHAFSQNVRLSAYSEISVITVGSGDDLYTVFGHTALRIKDPVLRLDAVYNYGMFDFEQPNFYTNFARGKLLYKLAAYPFNRFINQNNYEKRWVKEQVLALNQTERQKIFELLSINLQPQNATYLYDPFYNNCSTKVIQILREILPQLVLPATYVSDEDSMRSLMNHELDQNTWSSFGINMALGNKIDKNLAAHDYWYLPDYVYLSLKDAKIRRGKETVSMVTKENDLLKFEEVRMESGFLNPLFIFSILVVISVLLSIQHLNLERFSLVFDKCLFLFFGLIGLGIVFLWFFTDHTTTPNNFNLLWCNPLFLFFPLLFKRKNLARWMLIFYLILLTLIPIIWLSGVQNFNQYIILVLLSLIIRILGRISSLALKH